MNIRRLHRHAAASYRWLRPRQGPDGQWTDYPQRDIGAYFKAPWSFTATGDPEAALRALEHIEEHYLRPDGDIDHLINPKQRALHPFYPHAHIAVGAALAGRKDLAERILNYLMVHRHPDLRAWGSRNDGGRANVVDSISTASVGLAFLEGRQPEVAREAGAFLEWLLDNQQGPGLEFYTSAHGSGELLTFFPKDSAGRYRRIILSNRFEAWAAISFPVIFLARLHEDSGEEKWLRIANRYLAMLDRSGQAWNDISSGKIAFACAVLYRATGAKAYRQRALRAVRAMVSRQGSDGGWHACRGGEGESNGVPNVMGYDVSTEFAQWLSLAGAITALRDGYPWVAPARCGDESFTDRSLRQVERLILQKARTMSFQWH